MSNIEDSFLDSLQPHVLYIPTDIVIAAEEAIKRLKENPHRASPRITELLKKFLREHDDEGSYSSSEENQRMIGKKLEVLLSKEIGRGTDGTVVYEGRYEGREVAVKHLQQSHIKLAKKEIANLIVSDHGHNIVRCHGVKCDEHFIYLALECCACNLVDLIQMHSSPNEENILGNAKLWKANIHRPSSLLLNLTRDIVSGLVVLHNMRIVHRDLKRQNVLIIKQSSTLRVKLSDMGISRKLSDNKFSLTNHFSSCAATGWKAPEQLQSDGRQTRKMDLFSLGCVLFYCITLGREHPFGHYDERDGNIRKKKQPGLSSIKDFPEASDLISSLLQFDLENRPEAIMVMHHPLFWNAKTRLYFFRDVSDSVSENPNLLNGLESTAKTVLGTDSNGSVRPWDKRIFNNNINLKHQKLKGTYKFDDVKDLLRFIRNKTGLVTTDKIQKIFRNILDRYMKNSMTFSHIDSQCSFLKCIKLCTNGAKKLSSSRHILRRISR